MELERALEAKGIKIPEVPTPVAAYIPGVVTGKLVFVSGQAPTVGGRPRYMGKLGREISLDEGYKAARLAALNCIAELKFVLGDLDRVRRIVKVTGFVASTEGFDQQPKVVDGASELLKDIWGNRGEHARSAVGVSELPGGVPVEIEIIAEVH